MEAKTIGSFICALRRASGMTQREFAERLNVSDKTVSRWERDEGAPDLTLIPVIAEIFGVTCDDLLSPRRSSSQVTPKISAMTGMSVRSGAPSSRSQRLTVLSETLRRSAKSRWVMPDARRSAAMKVPMVFASWWFPFLGLFLVMALTESVGRCLGAAVSQFYQLQRQIAIPKT